MLSAKLWGVRGSLPAPHSPQVLSSRVEGLLRKYEEYRHSQSEGTVEQFLADLPPWELQGFGGNTACVQFQSQQESLIIDCGSGIRRLGQLLMGGPSGLGRGKIHILMTHFHWDHLIGLPFFVPIFIKGNEINFYSVQEDLEDHVRKMFLKPNFPVPFEALQSQIRFHQLTPRESVEFQDLTVTPYQLDHPDPCWGYKISSSDTAISYCVDTEGRRVSPSELGDDLPLYQGIDAMIFDAQYTFAEGTRKVNWGHSSAPIGLDLAIRERVPQVYFAHHDPAASDEQIASLEAQTREYYENLKKMAQRQGEDFFDVQWQFAVEGQLIQVERVG